VQVRKPKHKFIEGFSGFFMLPNDSDAIVAQSLADRKRSDGTYFVFAELATGLRICKALRLHELAAAAGRPWEIARAQISVEVAEDSMWQLKMSHADFNQMMALTERLKFEIEDLTRSMHSNE
jgi:hypothetical protein